MFFIETTHTPQGDGNRPYPLPRCTHRGNNPHPARGRKRTSLAIVALFFGNNPHPARGRKRGREHPRSTGSERNNPHPARGRKLEKSIACHYISSETTHTPQGDGNRLSIPVTRHLQETTHTPQGDGKPFVFTLQKLLEKPFTSPTGDN